ncbi:MAG: (2Fe-2S)-binding protein [Planctomycetes bacterium]|jgi:aerobic-type carbon monoxide dehydrogenase small subunit (CoxS/CutS family)|nr:(2Fe-2S)-binding protein [Planctomycetota bacterium]MBT4028560.1 (2Fe-2S)-binding protein [Planctomycetota bacterium]MBT4559452.1 (2Fe-2S)-binding protein [Planctomycetota bacterium]MBT5119583.1 (2Fe-2S)-binding protein [Planctomycetota bacterium]MBT7012729.1 (2Fe-2S)-binding protein [Planctomycetota bacterium]
MSESPPTTLRLSVNGHTHTVLARHADSLLDVLREQLGLTATKRGCDLGTCGCCLVQVDGEPNLSCLTLAAEVEGQQVISLEGLPDSGRFTPLQDTFAEMGASQCGFCTPGFLLTADAILRDNPTPTRDELRSELSGNLCRCTGFAKILDAIERCASEHRAFRGYADAMRGQA